MSFTPIHGALARGDRARRTVVQELIRVRNHYVEKRYKNCIAACDELLEQRPTTPQTPSFVPNVPAVDLHPVHRAFLIFHQAISYECLGIAAHKYSQNKLRYLESAQQKYDEALSVLPQPFTTAEDGGPILGDDSPTLRYGDDESRYDDDSSSAETAVPPKQELGSDCDYKSWISETADSPSLPEETAPSTRKAGSRLRSISELEEYHADAEEPSPIVWQGLDEAKDKDKEEVADKTEQLQVDGAMDAMYGPRENGIVDRSRSSSSASGIISSSLSRALSAPNFDDYSPRQEPEVARPLKAGQSWGHPPRSTASPFIDIGSADDSSEDEEPEHQQQSGIPRSMRSLNLAAYDASSSEDTDSAGGTPSKIPVARFNVRSTVPSTPRLPFDRSGDESDSTVASPSKIPVRKKLVKIAAPVVPKTPLTKAMEDLDVPSTSGTAHTNRLSASLSSRHVLCEELVPSPLFRKIDKTEKKLSKIVLDGELPPRPLPRTPYSFHNHLSLLPVRKTAVQTLISQFEGAIPSPGSSYITATPPMSAGSQLTHYTPITPRFQLIHDTFAPLPTQSRLEAYLTSRSLAAYNAQLTAFRTCIRDASTQVGDMLQAAEMLQYRHEEEKRASILRTDPHGLPTNRLASMWLLSTPGKPLTGPRPRKRMGRNGTTVNSTPARSLPRAESHSHPARQKILMRHRVDESEEKKAERLRRLRDNGFRVRKEGKGWKGEEHYEELRRGMERELGRWG